MSISEVYEPKSTLSSIFANSYVRDMIIIVADVFILALASQILIPLPFTPVPLSLGSLAVLLSGAFLGPIRASFSLGAYIILGVIGLPFFAASTSGWAFASFGYILGYFVAGVTVGYLLSKTNKPGLISTAAVFLLGTVIIYGFGVVWLQQFLGTGLMDTLFLGVIPFLVGDLLKLLLSTSVWVGTKRTVAHWGK